MRLISLIVVGTTGLMLSACQSPTNQQVGIVGGSAAGALIGNQFGSGSGKVAATVAGGLIGAFVGNAIGVSLDAQAEQQAAQAQMQALENGRPGTPVAWNSGSTRGEVIPGPRYNVNAYECRDYTHEIWIDGQPQTARGTACRQPDGTWRAVD
ncbi:glycine zipper 2TM domain-containing protein [Kaistia algarum]|uniref:glycine zipper 2TM domain-containing protein n=1 Tax=Kaistia algarum TaxID=2083279 RepID=UPI001A9CB67C|nr:glycine zipper 2TM domain-containing protein [Kaistia algarum]MCX5512106.1 glycine zipper 2TM domain-containing protein [Kaistia algarum]